MSRVTLNKVNAALAALGHEEVLVKGGGYFYFADGTASSWSAVSVYVYHLNDLTVEQWVQEHADLRKELH